MTPVNNVVIYSPGLLSVQILATVTATLYFIATGRCEPNPARTGDDSGISTGAAKPESSLADAAAKAAAPKVAAAVAVSAGQALFAPEGATAPVVPAALAATAATAAVSKASLFTGGSLFPNSGSSSGSKYTSFAGEDRPEANPFLSS